MRSNQSQKTLTAWLATALAGAAATSAPERWVLDIDRVFQGEWWRLASGHLVHLSWQHYLYDLLTLGVIMLLCTRLQANFRTIAFTGLCSASTVSLILLVAHPVDIYGGLSGISAGLLSFAALRLVSQGSPLSGIAMLGGMLIKVCLERQGLSLSGVGPVWQAHCAGAAAGAMVVAVSLGRCWPIFGKSAGRTP